MITLTYRIETPGSIEALAAKIASDQSTGTFVALPGETEELKARVAAREKKEWTRSCGQVSSSPAPVSMPVTVRLPVCPTRPATSAAKVAKLGAVKTLAF